MPTYNRLNNISSVKTVHTVSSENSFLGILLGRSFVRILGGFHVEIAIILKFMIHQIHKFGEILVLHFSAFIVEVKPNKFEALFVYLLVHFFKILTKPFLWAFLVDQIDKCTIFIMLFYVGIVFLCYLQVYFIISMNINLRAPL